MRHKKNEVLDDAYRAFCMYRHGNCSRRWLRVHKVTHILKLEARFVLDASSISTNNSKEDWSPCRGIHLSPEARYGHRKPHILAVHEGNILAMPGFNGNQRTHRNCSGCGLLR